MLYYQIYTKQPADPTGYLYSYLWDSTSVGHFHTDPIILSIPDSNSYMTYTNNGLTMLETYDGIDTNTVYTWNYQWQNSNVDFTPVHYDGMDTVVSDIRYYAYYDSTTNAIDIFTEDPVIGTNKIALTSIAAIPSFTPSSLRLFNTYGDDVLLAYSTLTQFKVFDVNANANILTGADEAVDIDSFVIDGTSISQQFSTYIVAIIGTHVSMYEFDGISGNYTVTDTQFIPIDPRTGTASSIKVVTDVVSNNTYLLVGGDGGVAVYIYNHHIRRFHTYTYQFIPIPCNGLTYLIDLYNYTGMIETETKSVYIMINHDSVEVMKLTNSEFIKHSSLMIPQYSSNPTISNHV